MGIKVIGSDNLVQESNNILIVDDILDNLRILTNLLEEQDYEIRQAPSGKVAIETVKHQLPDLILLDIKMSDMDGFEVCKKLKANELTRDVPIIFISAMADTEDKVNAFQVGGVDYITKPFHTEEVLARVKTHLHLRQLRKEQEHQSRLLEGKVLERSKALTESEQHYRHLLENLLVGISIIKGNRILYKNPEYERLFGPVFESTADIFFKKIHPDDAEKINRLYEKITLREIETINADFRYYPYGIESISSNMRWIQCRVSLTKYQGEEAILFNSMDVTKVKELEQALKIEDKMSSLGRVAAGIAHEIRNPLTGINSYLYNLQEFCNSEILEAENKQLVTQILSQLKVASQRIESVIKRVLDFSKPTISSMILSDINLPVQDAVELSSASLRKTGIMLKKNLTQNLPQCYADSQLICQVVLNLINNAAHAMKNTEGAKNIEIATGGSGNNVFVRVSDSGPGVSPDIRHKIFDPFFTTRSDGSGIGLSIVQRITADHGGTIEEGTGKYEGAEFILRLPVEKRNMALRD